MHFPHSCNDGNEVGGLHCWGGMEFEVDVASRIALCSGDTRSTASGSSIMAENFKLSLKSISVKIKTGNEVSRVEEGY